jgi:drug/metabolite transporter (DMT)-like permease
MALSALLFSCLGPFVRFLPGFPALEIVLFRSFFGIAMAVAWAAWQKKRLFGKNRKWLVLRGCFGFFGLFSYIYAMQRMPLAEAVVIQYTNPIFTALFAPFVLKEAWRGDEWLATGLSFLGVLLMAGPGSGGETWVALVALLGAVSVGFAYNIVRKLGLEGEEPMSVVVYLPLASLAIGLPMALPSWVMPSFKELGILLALGVSTLLAQLQLTKGLRLERAARATVMNYLIIALSTLYGIGFGEIPSLRSLAGMGLVFLSLLLLSRRQPAILE